MLDRIHYRPLGRALLASLASLGIAAGDSLAEGPRRPNIVFLFSDDHAYQAISAYNDPRRLLDTPNIDRLGRQGMRFDRCVVPNSICGPSRATILTGKYSHLNGFYNNSNSRFDGSQPTFPKILRASGYQTAVIGKWHLVSDPTGFDEWHILPGQGVYYNPPMIHNGRRVQHQGYVTDLITDLGLDWLRGRDRSKPFLLMLQHKAPHREWQPALRHLGHDGDRRYPEPDTLFDDYAGRGKAERDQDMTIARTMTPKDLKLAPPPGLNPDQRRAWDDYYEPRNAAFRTAGPEGKDLVRWKYQRYMHDYLGCVKAVDESVGRVLRFLDDEGLADNTIVVYSADQGFYLGEHGWFDKRWIFEESLRAPLLVRWPGVAKAGGSSPRLVSNVDFAATFLEAAGLPVPPDMQGLSLLPLLKGQEPADWRKSFYYEYYEYPVPHHVRPHYGVVTDRYKLVHFPGPDVDEWDLFDLQTDPRELRNVLADPAHAGVVAELKRELARLRAELKVPAVPPPGASGRPAAATSAATRPSGARLLPVIGLGLGLQAGPAPDREDRPVADFEGDTYLPWVAEGRAFGPGPALGTLPGQMAVSGFLGRGLASSFHGGDDALGTLTSPPFRVERPYLNFLIGGGKYPGETCLDLLVEGAVVRTATGPNDRPGGSERLDEASWDLADLMGKEVVLRVVDRRTGGWGHVSVDQIVQSDRPRGVVPTARELTVEARYLHLPVKENAPSRRVRLAVDGRTAREFDIKLAEGEADFLTFADLEPFRGKALKVEASLPAGSKALAGIRQAAEVPDPSGLYREKDRPQFHFTSRRGWLNDPNGLVWLDGEYHLFYQHNPFGWDWGNMHWGHAVSRDLVRWSELPIALYPRAYGDWAFSGSAVVDRRNTSGFGPEGSSPLVAAFTSTGRGECIASSLDRGRTWTEYAGNPVVKHPGRDPRLLWHEPTRRWVMAVYDEEGGRRAIAFHSSADLKSWKFESVIDGFFECPDLFELAVEGEPGGKLWVLSAADGQYLLGNFDGRRFNPESGKHRTWSGNFYAAQTFSDEPRGRRVQVGWAQGIASPGMPFNQQMSVPCELKLRPTDEGVRLFARPVDELATLRTRSFTWKDLKPGDDPLAREAGVLFDLTVEAEVGTAGKVTLAVPGAPVSYDAAKRSLSCGDVSTPLASRSGQIRFRVLVDRGSVEVFGEDGRVAISKGRGPRAAGPPLSISVAGEDTRVRSLELSELASSWATASPGPGPR